ncbi:MAG: protein phosphatase 2C domain-containing protein, partial [Bacteroidota bacterium]|nr:protein phosphatase 2C domain-containing protein [Bacteroidota bacterium]
MKDLNMNKIMLSKIIIIYCSLCIVIIPALYYSNLSQENNFEQNVSSKYSAPVKNQVTQSNSLISDQNIIVIPIYIGFFITIFLVVINYKYLKQITDKIQKLHERISNLMLELPFMYNEEENESKDKGEKVSDSNKEQTINSENQINEPVNSIFSTEKEHSFCRPIPEIIPIPDEFISGLISRTNEIPDIIHKPHISSKSWSSSANTIKGNVRKENQDYAICFNINDYQVSILADGVGGLSGGKRAAFNAVRASAILLVQSLGRNNQFLTKGLDTLALDCIKAASYQLAMEGDRYNIGHKGLRTTLIVIIAGKDSIGYAYIGDGGGCLVLESSEIIHFIKPQKVEGKPLNYLSASLGPTIHG